MNKPELKHLPVDLLTQGIFQPRRYFDQAALKELATSIKANGLIQPIVVRPISARQYEIIAGERRWRAAQLAGLENIPCFINDYSDEQAMAATVIENVNREDLNPIEEAKAYQRFIDEFEYLHEEIAAVTGKSRTKITNTLRLLRLDSKVQELLSHGQLSDGHGKVLAGVEINEQYELAQQCIAHGWSVRKMEQAVKTFQQTTTLSENNQNNPNLVHLERVISEQLGSEVRLEHDMTKRSGWLKIKYFDADTLSGLLDKMGVESES